MNLFPCFLFFEECYILLTNTSYLKVKLFEPIMFPPQKMLT